MRFNRIVPILGAAIVLAAPSVQAQNFCETTTSCPVTNLASVTLGDMFRLTLDGTTTALTAPLISNFDNAGLAAILNNGPIATVLANRTWKVSVEATTDYFDFDGSPGTKDASDLEWEANGAGGTYANHMGVAADLFSGNATNGTSKQIMYRTNWSLAEDGAGLYELDVQFTVSAP